MQTARTPTRWTPIIRAPLGGIAASRLRELILSGELTPGTPLAERELALRLGVSRTPIRDALAELEGESLVITNGRSLCVAPLLAEEINELYVVLAAIERAAVKSLAGKVSKLVRQLSAIRAKGSQGNVRQLVEQDAKWHQALVLAAGNEHLRSAAERARTLALRYELAYFTDSKAAAGSCVDHQRVEALLRAGKLPEAADTIERHWLGNVATMTAAIQRKSIQ